MKRVVGFSAIILVVVGVLCVAAFYASDIEMFIRLRGWDKQAPGRTVGSFLSAAKRGDADSASQYIETSTYKPLKKGDKVVGYFVSTQAGTMQFPFEQLAPEGEVQIRNTEFVLLGEGSADVTAAWKANEDAKFRLKMINGSWIITEIRSGGIMIAPPSPVPAKQAPAPPGGSTS